MNEVCEFPVCTHFLLLLLVVVHSNHDIDRNADKIVSSRVLATLLIYSCLCAFEVGLCAFLCLDSLSFVYCCDNPLAFFNKKMSRSTLRLPGHALFDNFCFRQAKHKTSTGGATIIEIRNSTCCYIDFDKQCFL